MEMHHLLNKCTKKLEFLVISFVVSFYLLSIYDTIFSSHKIIPLYFCLLSLYYYISLLTCVPGEYIDFNTVERICKKCNRLSGRQSVHCEICNRCFYKRDHHCVITGKCIESNNLKYMYLTVLFLFIYSLFAMFRTGGLKELTFFYNFTCILSGFLLIWVTLLILTDKTTANLLKDIDIKDLRLKNIKKIVENGWICTLCPVFYRSVKTT
ncbi:palmitoyltransferase [Vairimorpha necatrix]|uniref:Palmitoyltransferase n=1 Tax=Vairimorpha necatrix TaxID=6039 RepID=A0AAX4JFD3_9MICR